MTIVKISQYCGLQELAGLGLLTYSCSSSCSSVHLFICSSVHLFIFLILTGVPAEGLGRGAEDRGVCVPKIQTQSPFIGQFGHFCGPIGRGKHHPYLPIHLLKVQENRDKNKYLSNIGKNDEQQYYFTSPNYANHFPA